MLLAAVAPARAESPGPAAEATASAPRADTRSEAAALAERLARHQGEVLALGELLPGDWRQARLWREPDPLVHCYLPNCVPHLLRQIELIGGSGGPRFVAWPASAPTLTEVERGAELTPQSRVHIGRSTTRSAPAPV